MKPYRNDSSGSVLLIFSELKQKQLEYSFLLGVKVQSHVNPCSHTTSIFAFSSNVMNGSVATSHAVHTQNLLFQELDSKDQRKTQTKTLRINVP